MFLALISQKRQRHNFILFKDFFLSDGKLVSFNLHFVPSKYSYAPPQISKHSYAPPQIWKGVTANTVLHLSWHKNNCQWWDMNQIVMTVLWEAWCRQRCNLVNKYYLCHRQYLLHLAEPMKGNWSFKKIISFQTIGFMKRNHISWQTTKNISNLSSMTSSYDRPGKATSHYHL